MSCIAHLKGCSLNLVASLFFELFATPVCPALLIYRVVHLIWWLLYSMNCLPLLYVVHPPPQGGTIIRFLSHTHQYIRCHFFWPRFIFVFGRVV